MPVRIAVTQMSGRSAPFKSVTMPEIAPVPTMAALMSVTVDPTVTNTVLAEPGPAGSFQNLVDVIAGVAAPVGELDDVAAGGEARDRVGPVGRCGGATASDGRVDAVLVHADATQRACPHGGDGARDPARRRCGDVRRIGGKDAGGVICWPSRCWRSSRWSRARWRP